MKEQRPIKTRNIKPNIFEILKNGVCLDQFSHAADQQKWLEQNVLKMNYKSFTQIVILGSSSFIPFMQLSSNHRREVIEDLLDIKIFSAMNAIIRDKIRDKIRYIYTFFIAYRFLRQKSKICHFLVIFGHF